MLIIIIKQKQYSIYNSLMSWNVKPNSIKQEKKTFKKAFSDKDEKQNIGQNKKSKFGL